MYVVLGYFSIQSRLHVIAEGTDSKKDPKTTDYCWSQHWSWSVSLREATLEGARLREIVEDCRWSSGACSEWPVHEWEGGEGGSGSGWS